MVRYFGAVNMNYEEARRASFTPSWSSVSAIEPDRMAAAGFFFKGRDLVQCFSCGTEVRSEELRPDLMSNHLENGVCVFAQDPALSGNVPVQLGQLPTAEAEEPSSPASQFNSQPSPNARIPHLSVGRWTSSSSVYKSEQNRFESFLNWPIPFIVKPEALAATGFYFLGQGDKVACAFCTGIVNRWERGDVPKEEHKRHFPNCPFLLGVPVGNVPRNNTSSADSLAELGIQPHRGPRNPKCSTVESRLRTFERWPPDLAQKPIDLAQAGFFHDVHEIPGSPRDQVRCFHCDGGLRNWEPSDSPWREHARCFPQCPFLLLVKGQRFVDEVQQQFREGAGGSTDESQSHKESMSSPLGLPTGLSISMPSLASEQATASGGSVEAARSSTSSAVPPEGPMGAEALEEENRRLRDARQCKICMDAEIGTVLLPCGHLVACVGCAPSLLDCPVCRVVIKATVRTFLS